MVPKTVMDTSMVNISQETLINKVEYPYVVPVEDPRTSVHKKLILCKKNSKCAVSRKVKKLNS